jgi:uncharacterized hydrophobic protein (TIGR00341 family)
LKKIEITVNKGEATTVTELLKKMGLIYIPWVYEVEGQEFLFCSVTVPDDLADKIVNDVSAIMDLRLKENSISVLSIEGVVSSFLERLRTKTPEKKGQPGPVERLVEMTEPYIRLRKEVVIMALFATVIALTGLFLDNVAILIGGMLLSPLLGPINAFAVNASLGRLAKLQKSLVSILFLLSMIIALSTAITFVASRFVFLPLDTVQIALRSHATLIDIGVALVLGLAGGLALSSDLPEMLVGVAIAVALLPPAVVSGIGLAVLDQNLFIGALVLTFVYLFGLQLGCIVMLRIRGVWPRNYFQKAEAKKHSAYSIVILAGLVVFLAVVVLLSPLI